MNADSTFQIGHDHVICEDYALAGTTDDMAYGVVCDGCSASPDVDFGARCLAVSARESILNGSMFVKDFRFLRNPLGNGIARHASAAFKLFPSLNSLGLDATLLMVAYSQVEKNVTVVMHGDGVLVKKLKNGNIVATHIEVPTGAPDYPSYSLNWFREKNYYDLGGNDKKVTTIIDREEDVTREVTQIPIFEAYVEKFTAEEVDIIAVISDGSGSFRQSNNDDIDWFEIAKELTAYKTTAGQFVLRRMNAFKRKCAKEGWTHSDDISIAAIVV